MNFKALLIIFFLIFNIISNATHVNIDHHEEHKAHCELCINSGLSLSQNNTLFSINILKEHTDFLLSKNSIQTDSYLFQFKRGPPLLLFS